MPIIDGTTSAGAALRYLERKQEVVANNLANASTSAFKSEHVFARLMGNSLPHAESATNLSAGELETTSSPLDVAVKDKGFFVVSTPAGERWSRGGSLLIDSKNQLTTLDGNPVLGVKGPVVVDPTLPIEIAKNGEVSQNGVTLDVLRQEAPKANESLNHQGASLIIPGATRDVVPPADRTIAQGHLEGSNVNTMSTLVDMIGVQRAYASVEKALVELDKVHETATTEIGRPAQ